MRWCGSTYREVADTAVDRIHPVDRTGTGRIGHTDDTAGQHGALRQRIDQLVRIVPVGLHDLQDRAGIQRQSADLADRAFSASTALCEIFLSHKSLPSQHLADARIPRSVLEIGIIVALI